MISKVISGGQNGADIAALRAARRLGIPTGGWMPLGFRTLDGPRPEYADLYGVKVHSSPDYPPRTRLNVQESAGTIRFAADFSSPGERCTLNAIRAFNRPYFDVDLLSPDPDSIRKGIDWIRGLGAGPVVNVAGNSEWSHPGTEAKVEAFLSKLLGRMRHEED